jgi:hypothetical protein
VRDGRVDGDVAFECAGGSRVRARFRTGVVESHKLDPGQDGGLESFVGLLSSVFAAGPSHQMSSSSSVFAWIRICLDLAREQAHNDRRREKANVEVDRLAPFDTMSEALPLE